LITRLQGLLRPLLGSVRDLAPIVGVIAFFQLAVLQQPLPNLLQLLGGLALVLVGLTLFIQGLELGLFPLGESMAHAFARKGSLGWLLAFCYHLLNGLRHLVWDTGRGFEIEQVERSGWVVLISSAVLALLLSIALFASVSS